MKLPTLKPQEIPFDSPNSSYRFLPGPDKPFVSTKTAVEEYGHTVIIACVGVLQILATEHDGIDYLQVFEDPAKSEPLWFIEDGPGGAITALLSSDY